MDLIRLRSLLVIAFGLGFGATVICQWKPQASGTAAHLRGISALSSTVAWASGSKGTYVRTTDGGTTWISGAVPGASELDFRDVEAVDANAAYLLATAGKIFKTSDGGSHWALQYDNNSPGVFLDAFAFWDAEHGIALGDPMKGRFLLIATSDGGATWNQIPPGSIPPAIEGEAAFAASGTCLVVEGKSNVWFGTGGRAARVFRSTDRGVTWQVSPSPIISGADSTGIFSVAFKDSKNGLIVGGDYKKPDKVNANAARTIDGGATWTLIERQPPTGFRSAVAYIPGTANVIAVGEAGSDLSTDDGASWKSISKEGYHAIAVGASIKGVWAAGRDGRIGMFNALDRSAAQKQDKKK